MQGYVILMVLLVIVGTILDMMHKQSAKYFFENAKRAQNNAKRTLGGGEKASFAMQTVVNEVLTSSEFKRTNRRISHLFTMYGFVIFVVSTAVLIFGYATVANAGIWPVLWHLNFNGRGDIFIVGLITMPTFALLWSATLGGGSLNMLFFVLFIACSTVLFGTVFWSKFAHMFFKPFAAYQKKCIMADGSRENLPADYDLTDPAVHAKFPDIPEYMGKNPPNMGPGINAEGPRHY
jgi:hypothetical protein